MEELDSSITLSVPIDEQNELYAFFKHLDEFVESQNLCPNKKENKFINIKNETYFLKLKSYITTNIFIHGDNNPQPKMSIMDFNDYLKEGTDMRFRFSIGNMFEISGEYGFQIYAQRLQLNEPPRTTITFADITEED